MSKRNINIEHLQIRMRGISPETARAAVGDLGHEILSQLTGTTQVASGTEAGELRQRIAKQVAGSIAKEDLPQRRKGAKERRKEKL
ncbi:MAG TPA: hypothetical protein VKA78_06365 [Pyrinomonadaceae bacterium]|nr:hypothetical protein [Pyrinomonadaceae bacterium]